MASPTLGIAIAKKVHGTRLATRLASHQKETDEAKTAPPNQNESLPPQGTSLAMLTYSRRRALMEHHLIPWDDPTLREKTSHHRGYHSSPLYTHHTAGGNGDWLHDSILPTVNSVCATVTLTLDSLHPDVLPPSQPPPPLDGHSNSDCSDKDTSGSLLCDTKGVIASFSDLIGYLSCGHCGNCEHCDDYDEEL